MESIGERIVNLRKKKGLTQMQLAEKLNISDKAVSKWESGKGDPSVEMLCLLADMFECTTDFLIRGKNNIILDNPSITKIDEPSLKKISYAEQVFNKMLDYIILKVTSLSFDVWIKPLEPLGIDQDSLTGEYSLVLQVSTRNAKQLIIKNYFKILMRALKESDNKISNIIFVVDNPFIDPYFKSATKLAIENNAVSVAYLQRRLQIGYSRAAEIIDAMEDRKFISSINGRKMRDVYIDKKKYEEVFKESFDSNNK